ncbi:VanZ family protein [Peterkaempfera griseoplana]|uniref:VanZ family protein n=1 Tax=Peterkaempfera griseoplana TaxID=66896 RepID=UPI0006E2BB7C|nr:VanZ family protein [Peterkaempfera griseoplana]
MLTAIVSSYSGLIPAFLVAAFLLGTPCALALHARQRSTVIGALLGASLAAVLTATLYPTGSTDSAAGRLCEAGGSLRGLLSTEQGRLNLALFVPLCLLAVLVVRRPLLVLAGAALLSGTIEALQATLPIGRSCDRGDFIANVLGAAAGLFLGVLTLLLTCRTPEFTIRAALQDVGALGMSVVALVLTYQFVLTPVHRGAGLVAGTPEQNRAARSVTERLFGRDVKVTAVQLMEATPASGAQLMVTTTNGRLTLSWPAQKLISAMSVADDDNNGQLSQEQLRTSGERFAAEWFPDEVRGSKETFQQIAPTTRARLLTYRRYVDGVMMPMRLGITVSSSGRIIGIDATRVPDPHLPRPVIGRAQAQRLASGMFRGTRSGTAVLVAQQVGSAWRPCWVVDLHRPGQTEAAGTVLLDAVTGALVENRM